MAPMMMTPELDSIPQSVTDTTHCVSNGIGPDVIHKTTLGASSFAYDEDFSQIDPCEPVAIVGMACRLPGNVGSPSELWRLLLEGGSGQCKVPKSRFDVDAFYHPNGSRAGSMNTMGGYFLEEDVRNFENSFFGINNLEATYLDPQQRKLLEVVFECFESAGASLESVAGANAGVYVGNFTVDFQTMQSKDPEYLHRYSATGMGTTILANRISHTFDLRGPSFTLDTACSSSIYCLHNAVTALNNNECDAAVVAGANLITTPEQHLGTMKAGVLSATSTCHTFEASADGYGRADGVSALYLKRLSSAIKDCDPIRAVIRGTAINANGKTPGITLPSVDGQEEVIRKAYRKAGLDVSETDYVECHGTGTPVGDPIEVEALSRVFSPKRHPGKPLLIGSVKSNLGHSEAASGITSILKAVLAFENGKIPATIGIKNFNPKIKFDDWNIKVVTNATDWPSNVRRASINSFGYGGANAHAILESVDSLMPGYQEAISASQRKPDPDQEYVLPLSASTATSLNARVLDLAQRLKVGPKINISDLSYTLSFGRSHFGHRGFLITSEATMKEDFRPENLITTKMVSTCFPLCFVFTGQGAQWPCMGKELLRAYPIFEQTIDDLDQSLQDLPEAPSWTLKGTILEPAASSNVNEVTHSQPLCTAIQIALVDLLRSWGVQPAKVVGHSSGEIAAAYTAGLLTADQAIAIAYYRGYVVSKAASKGAMVAAGMDAESAKRKIEAKGLLGQVNVACVNSPESVTLSGESEAVDAMLTELENDGVFARKLRTGDTAYHSHLMRAIGSRYEELLANCPEGLPASQDVKMYSSVTPEQDLVGHLSPRYWRQNLESPVLFYPAMKQILNSGDQHLVEIGPHSALQLPIKQIRTSLSISDDKLRYSPALIRDKDSSKCLKTLAGNLDMYGHTVNLARVNTVEITGKKKVRASIVDDLPPYRWTYDTLLWNEPRQSIEFRNRKHARHELLGSKTIGGNGVEHIWRNKIDLKEVSWIEDHLLESTVVFPAAGYIAMAVEAIAQLKGSQENSSLVPSYALRSVNIQSALVLRAEGAAVELFTTVRSESLSTATTSDFWYDFEIVSYQNGASTKHCTGSIMLELIKHSQRTEKRVEALCYENWTMGRWYEQLEKQGLCYGPAFRALTAMKTDKAKKCTDALSTTKLLQSAEPDIRQMYPLHPITIDMCLQAAIMGGTAGQIAKLRAYLPVFISNCRITPPAASSVGSEALIHSWSRDMGFGTRQIDIVLRDQLDKPVLEMGDVRLTLYNGKSEEIEPSLSLERHPCLRILWKPDFARLDQANETSLKSYLQQFAADHSDISESESTCIAAGMLDLLAHKNPRIRILELGRQCECKNQDWSRFLGRDTTLVRYSKYEVGTITEDGRALVSSITSAGKKTMEEPVEAEDSSHIDVLILSNRQTASHYLRAHSDSLSRLLSPQGSLIAFSDAENVEYLTKLGLAVISLSKDLLYAFTPLGKQSSQHKGREFIIVDRDSKSSPLCRAIESHFSSKEISVKSVAISEQVSANFFAKSTVISLLELNEDFLPTMSAIEMDALKRITDYSTEIVWLTNAGGFDGTNPNLSLANGLSRALMLEHPSLRFTTVDLNLGKSAVDSSLVCDNIEKVLNVSDAPQDKEFIQRNGLLHVSRFVPDNNLNAGFRQKMASLPTDSKLVDASPARLEIEKVGMFDSIYFSPEEAGESQIPEDFVDVDVRAVSLNAKDMYVLAGKVETRDGTCTLEYGGVIRGVSHNVSTFAPGDRVVVLAPGHFKTTERVPVWACQKLLPGEDFETMATLPVVYATALYALHNRANLVKGESVLIHSGAGGVGIAAIEIAQKIGAEIYTTVSTEDKKDFLVKYFGIPRHNIFNSRSPTFSRDILQATNDKGVDVILNSLTGDLLHESWRCCASFGRFVEIGKRDILDAGKLRMDIFSRNVTFTAFDMSELYYHKSATYRDVWTKLFKQVLDLYRAGEIRAITPVKIFDVSQATQAYRHFSSKNRMGKVVISLQNPESIIRAVSTKYSTRFDSTKSYLLVGCLGGLGRSLSRWMMSRGARRFCFVGRSGTDKSTAREMVDGLRKSGAIVQVVRGNVVNYDDIIRAVDACETPIGGVIQAAMGLSEALFSAMTHEAWHTGIQPKWKGTWNLHNALQGKDDQLDFFLMTSSISGSVGTATESNYCAANGFLDAFARYRASLGKPATSIGLGMISEVGYLHENPEIEALLLRKGIHPLNEEEFLQVCDLALSTAATKGDTVGSYDTLAATHILTGLEPQGVREMKARGFEVNNNTMQDSRMSLLSAMVNSDELDTRGLSSGAALPSGGLPLNVQKALESGAADGVLLDAVLGLIRKRFSNLILLPLDQVDDERPLSKYGMDSMLAAEFRTWFFQSLTVDVQFMELMASTATVRQLAQLVEIRLLEASRAPVAA